jgi:hypothetical protein
MAETAIPGPRYNPWTPTDRIAVDVRNLGTPGWRRFLPILEEWDEDLHSLLIDEYFRCMR